MREYIALLFGVTLIAGIVRVTAPDGQMKNYINILCSLCVLAAVVIPVSHAFIGTDGLSELLLDNLDCESQGYDEIYNQYIAEEKTELAEQQLAAELAESCGVSEEAFDVELALSDDGALHITAVTVTIKKEAVAAEPAAIKAYVKERTNSECCIIYDFYDEK